MRPYALLLAIPFLASCSWVSREWDGLTTTPGPESIAQAEIPALVIPSVRPSTSGTQYSLYSIHFQVRAPKPGGGMYVRADSTFSGFAGQRVRWMSASAATPVVQGQEAQAHAATGLFACVRLLGASSTSPDALGFGMEYSSASLTAESTTEKDVKPLEVRHSAGSLPDMILSMGTQSSVAMGDGSWLDVTATRIMVEKSEVTQGVEAMRKKQTAMTKAQRNKETEERDSIARALGAKNASCPL